MDKLLVLSLLTILATGCSTMNHGFMRGTIVMEVDQKTAHICLGDNEVTKGDTVIFYINNCDRNDSEEKGLRGLCKLQALGKGTISKTLNSHYSEVKTDGTFSLRRGTLVQKD